MSGLDPVWVAFWVGIASGLVTSFLIFVFRRGIAKVLSAVAGLLSRKVRGKWETKFQKSGQSFNELAQVYQLFHWVWGNIDYPGEGKWRKYRFRGVIHSNVLVATYEVKGDRNKIDCGAFTLFINLTADEMKGKYSWTDDETQKPEADTYEWRKAS